MNHEPNNLDEARKLGHEPDFVATRTILFWGVVLFGLIVLSFMVVVLFKGVMDRALGEDPTIGIASSDETPVPPGIPTLNADQAAELARLVESQQAWLDSYAWEDKPTGIARIPIDRAMAIIVKDGFPVLPPTPITSGAPQPDTPQTNE